MKSMVMLLVFLIFPSTAFPNELDRLMGRNARIGTECLKMSSPDPYYTPIIDQGMMAVDQYVKLLQADILENIESLNDFLESAVKIDKHLKENPVTESSCFVTGVFFSGFLSGLKVAE